MHRRQEPIMDQRTAEPPAADIRGVQLSLRTGRRTTADAGGAEVGHGRAWIGPHADLRTDRGRPAWHARGVHSGGEAWRRAGPSPADGGRIRAAAGAGSANHAFQRADWLVAVQAFGGFGTGLFAGLTPIWLADATRGSGRYNLSQGVMAAMRALGATSSGLLGGLMVEHFGYCRAYLSCGVIGAIAAVLLWFGIPGVRRRRRIACDRVALHHH